MNRKIFIILFTLALNCFLIFDAKAQITAFTFQGRLTSSSAPANGTFEMQFRLFNTPNTGTGIQQGATVTNSSVLVANGIFAVNLDFGDSVFTGNQLYLEISLRPAGSTSNYTLLAPRQPITAAPYAVRSLKADTAVNAASLGGIAAENYLQVTGNGSGLTDLSASNISTGTLADERLSSNVPLKNSANVFGGNQTIIGDLSQTGNKAEMFLYDGFVTSGIFNSGAIPASGAGVRMMFYTRKAAFRAGRVSGTQWNDANIGNYSIALGRDTTASGYGSVALGDSTTASGMDSIAMGAGTTASGFASTAMGQNASTNFQEGSFVYGDASPSNLVKAEAPNSWTIRASGGYRFFTNQAMSTGVYLSANGGAWNSISDRNAKDNITAVDSRQILRGVLRLPISTWNYKGQPQFLHIGPMAQDFHSIFKVGENDRTITSVDPDGVALAAIQGLNEELKDRDQKIEQQQQKIEQQQKQLNQLQETVSNQQAAIDALRKFLCEQNPQAAVCKLEK